MSVIELGVVVVVRVESMRELVFFGFFAFVFCVGDMKRRELTEMAHKKKRKKENNFKKEEFFDS